MHFETLVFVCNLLTSVTGLIAAWYWYRSASVKYPIDDLKGTALIGGGVDVDMNPLLRAVLETARLNKCAASYTAGAAVLLAVSTFIGALR
jgi:hypothetical protein